MYLFLKSKDEMCESLGRFWKAFYEDIMKIIQLIQKPQLRGAEIFACQLSHELNKQGHESILVTIFDGNIQLPFDGRMLSLNGSLSNRIWDWRAWKKLTEIVALEKPDLIQANAGDTLKYAVFSKLVFRWKVPIIFRNASTVSLYIKHPLVKWWNTFLYSVTDYVISVSHYTKKDFLTVFPRAASKISVVPIGIVRSLITEEKIKERDTPLLLHVGGFTFEKNHVGLIRIFEKVLEHHPMAVLWLIGDGPLRGNIESLVQDRSLTDKVKFLGYQVNPMQFFWQADVFVLPSIIEGLPAVILESFYCKVPVIAYNVGGISELVRPGKTGWLVEKGDEQEFASAVLESLNNKNTKSLFADNAYQLLISSYGIERVTESFIERYKMLLGSA